MKLKTFNLKDLNPAEYNPRTITNEALAGLQKSIKKFGYIQPIVVNVRDKKNPVIVGGHQRVKAMLISGIKEAECITVDFDPVTEKAANVAMNAETISGDWETEGLETLLNELKIEFPAFDDINLDELAESLDLELETFFEGENEHGDADNIPEVNEKTVIRAGDLIELGEHRVLCGDSTEREDVELLMSGEKAEILFTSPPYADLRDYGGNVDLSVNHLINFIPAFYPFTKYQVINLGIKRKDSEIIEYWQDYILKAKESGYKLLSWNVWDKTAGGSIASATAMFVITHEWLFVFGEETKKLNRTISNDLAGYKKREGYDWEKGKISYVRGKDGNVKTTHSQTYTHHQLHTVIQQTPELGPIREKHPAIYPVGLPEQYIEAMTDKNQIITDPFLGSGTTLIACEKTGRKCYGMEIDPAYCQVIIQRWCTFTGVDKIIINSEKVLWSEYKKLWTV